MKSQNAYYLLLAVITILFVSIIFNFAAPILWSVVVSIIFYPVYEKFLLMTNKKSLSSILSLILILLLVIMPSIAILGLIGNELIIFINSSENYSFERYAEMIPDESIINELIGWSGLNISQLLDKADDFLITASKIFYKSISTISANVISFFVSLFIFIYLTFFFLKDGEKILQNCMDAFPMKNEDESYLLNVFQKTTRATIKGTVIVALAQGFLGYLTLLLIEIDGALIWGFVMALLSIIPAVGTILVWLPIALVLFLNGEVMDASLLIFSGIFIIGMIDNLLRPILIGKETKIPDYLILLTTIGGISIFGITGFIVGPIIASLFISVWSLSSRV
ncbi:MAG TPA: AI-2E family transporter [Gammaproteobacteria bacterium]|nr:AI-2E family transporter [Gammaproteobacteria bacterium]HJN01186.1 AI-2E family transporter [Gammaproteobacteria bacterium]